LSSPEHPATSFPLSAVLCLIPLAVLRPMTQYVTEVWAEVNGHPPQCWRWSFTTTTLRAVAPTDHAALRAAAAQAAPVSVRGKVLSGGWMPGAVTPRQAYLMLGDDPSLLVSVVLNEDAWRAWARVSPTAACRDPNRPEMWTGVQIEAHGAPALVRGAFLNIQVGEPCDLQAA